jgi:tetratricopeptide (TPR) repeat protein/tRNA A-37 threonylcarbamoyl transferase component Bud32
VSFVTSFDSLSTALSDRYRIERPIGRGGMATVYLAEDLKHHRRVAIKVLRPELAAALGKERFLREIEITAKLNHPHILPLLDSGEADGFLFYVMPYVEGESLRDRLNREKQLPVDEALKIASEVADALDFANAHNVIHRDIKPENILLEANHAVVADFGVARAIAESGETRLTGTGIAIGTPSYLSPEQAAGERDLDGRSDVYAVGCVLYEMLTGQPPFTGPTAGSLVHQHLTAMPHSVEEVRPTVPKELAATISKTLAKAPADRHQTAEALGQAIAAARMSLVAPSGGGKRRLSFAVVAAAMIIAVAGAITVLVPRGSRAAFDSNRVLIVELEDETEREDSRALGRMAQAYIIQTLTDAGFANVVDPITSVAVSRNVAAAGVEAGPADIMALADDAQARTVVAGSYYAADDSIHIQIRITDARDGSILGTVGPVVGTVGAPTELVARLGKQVVGTLAALLDQDIGSWEPTVQPATYEAYEAYSEGFEAYLWEEGYAEAARNFERAATADSTFYRAALWAAQSYVLLGPSHYAKAESLIAPLIESRGQLSRYERCRLDFLVALGIRPSLSACYDAARCMAQAAPGSDDAKREVAIFTWRLNRPREAIETLRELDPDRGLMKQFSDYWGWLAAFHHMLGDYEEELQAAREGMQRFPEILSDSWREARALAALGRLDEVAANLETVRSQPSRVSVADDLGLVAVFLRTHGHHDRAQDVFAETIDWYRLQPQSTESVRAGLAHWLYQAERWNEAQRLYDELAQDHPENDGYLAGLGRLAARRGDTTEALTVSEELRARQRLHVIGWRTLDRARIAALLGDAERATTLLGQAIEQSPQWGLHLFVHSDIDFDSVRDYQPFQELMRPKG